MSYRQFNDALRDIDRKNNVFFVIKDVNIVYRGVR